jgi:lipopolysaccharide biosynthesis protein
VATENEHELNRSVSYVTSVLDVPLVLDVGGHTLRPHWEDKGWLQSSAQIKKSPLNLSTHNVAIYSHIYYPEVYKEIIDSCNTLQKAAHFVTTDSIEKAAIIKAFHDRWSCHRDIEIQVFPNRGRDLAPLLCGWGMEPAQHKVVLHLHSKVSNYDPGFGTSWRKHMLSQLINSTAQISEVINQLKFHEIGLIIPWPHDQVAHCCHWGPNYSRSKQLLKLIGLRLKRYNPLSFPAGSFFWCNGTILKSLLELGLKVEDFAIEPIDQDGYLPHALERCLGFIPSLCNLKIAVSAKLDLDEFVITNLPAPFEEEEKYYEIYENLLDQYCNDQPELFGGKSEYIKGPL